MKNLLFCLFLFIASRSSAATCTLIVDNGDWSTAANWSCASPFAAGDIMVIPAGMTVAINGNNGTYTNLRIEVYGTMDFSNGSKITLDADGVVDVYLGGTVTGGNAGSRLKIGADDRWDGNDPPIIGPETINNAWYLPIELINWQGDNKNATNHFSWTTASEINNAYFSLERSFDTENWEVIAEINGAGNSSLFIQYEYNDSDYKNTINYYRLRQIDFDGNNETFKTIAINNTLNSTLEIVKIVNLMGQEVNNNYTGFRVVMYNDGSRELIKSYPQ